ncbi:hypothetical protein AVEN_186087-1 [Araneus ventricosus]|uniref:Uncharacterized protein n=1 Tax=Araneus ventricosus TaxID=182803 RepID=A0A4Y2P2F1_ARAVE|nr:hypothetical protein AVEN_186087-1 [Araneus ventricosus]
MSCIKSDIEDQTSSLWRSVEVSGEDMCRPRHLTMVRNLELFVKRANDTAFCNENFEKSQMILMQDDMIERLRMFHSFCGRGIIEACILPIGSYFEEAQEARNKHNRQYRELFTRKSSRINTNTDLLHRLLVLSDPYIASLRAAPKSEKRKMDREMKKLLELCLSDEEDSVIVSDDSSEESSSSE